VIASTSRQDVLVATLLAVLLLLVLRQHLAVVLLMGLATFIVYRRLLKIFQRVIRLGTAEVAALALTVLILGLLGLSVAKVLDVYSPSGSFAALLRFLADAVERLRSALPSWLASSLPASTEEMQTQAAAWLRSNSQHIQRWGQDAVRALAHILVGFVIGLAAAFQRSSHFDSAWMSAARQRGGHLLVAFSEVVSAQLRIAAVNTLLTAIFLLLALPVAGVHIPLSSTLVALTFVMGLLPIVGNLISNAAIVLVALTVSPTISFIAVAFLLVVHKLEYLLNAHFVGRSTSVPPAVLLASMVFLEAFFGVAGLVCAPIYCAWVFREMKDGGLLGRPVERGSDSGSNNTTKSMPNIERGTARRK
jgi:predicted PurR-regulated permease PerM